MVGKWLNQYGMSGLAGGANVVLIFRTLLLSRRFDAFWKDRVASRAASNPPSTSLLGVDPPTTCRGLVLEFRGRSSLLRRALMTFLAG